MNVPTVKKYGKWPKRSNRKAESDPNDERGDDAG